MANVTVCARFRPLSSKERRDDDDSVCIQGIDAESFIFKDEKDEELTFSFDRVFYPGSEQAEVYGFVALPIVKDVFNTINGTIVTYGQVYIFNFYEVLTIVLYHIYLFFFSYLVLSMFGRFYYASHIVNY